MKKLICLSLLAVSLSSAAQDLVPYCKNGKFGYSDSSGKIIIAAQYDYVSPFKNYRAIVRKVNEYFLIDAGGSEKTEKFSDIKETDKGYFIVKKSESSGLIDQDGKILIPASYDEIKEDYFTFVASAKSGKSVLFDRKINRILDADSTISVDGYEEDSILVISYKKGKKYLCGIYTSALKKVYGPEERNISVSSIDDCGLYTVEIKNVSNEKTVQAGVIDKEGIWLILPQPANDRPEFVYTKEFEKREKLENLGEQFFTKRDEYNAFLDATYCRIGYADSSFRFYRLSGSEIFSCKKNKAGSEIKFKNASVKTNMFPTIIDGNDLIGTSAFLFYVSDREGDNMQVYCVTRDGKVMNKKAWDDADFEHAVNGRELIIYEKDSLLGMFREDGMEIIPLVLTELEKRDDYWFAKDKAGKESVFKITEDFQFNRITFYGQLDNINSDYFIISSTKGNDAFYSLLEKEKFAEITPETYSFVSKLNKGILLSNGIEKEAVYYQDRKKIMIPAGKQLIDCIDIDKKQYVAKTGAGYAFLSGEKESLFFGNPNFEDFTAYNYGTLNGIYYFGLMSADSLIVFTMKDNQISVSIPMSLYNKESELIYSFSLKNENGKTNIMNGTGKQLVPFGDWKFLSDWKSDYPGLMSAPVYFAKDSAKSVAYNANGELLFSCSQCELYGEDNIFADPAPVISCSNQTRGWIYLYSDATKKTLNVPLNINSEVINDSCYFMLDTLEKAYLYFAKQNRVLKIPFESKEMSFADLGDHYVIYIKDNKEKWHVYNPVTDDFSLIPGYIKYLDPVHETWKGERHQYFYYYADPEFTKMGIMNELGQPLTKAEYDRIEMQNDNDIYGLFTCTNAERTDLVPINGKLIIGPQKYTSVYEEGNNLLYAEFYKGDKKFIHLYNGADNYKRINYTFPGTVSYINSQKIGNKWYIEFEDYYYEKKTENGETFDEDKSFKLFVDADGKEYFEFDDRFRRIDN